MMMKERSALAVTFSHSSGWRSEMKKLKDDGVGGRKWIKVATWTRCWRYSTLTETTPARKKLTPECDSFGQSLSAWQYSLLSTVMTDINDH